MSISNGDTNVGDKPLWKQWPFRITFVLLLAAMVFCVMRIMDLEAKHPGALKNTVENGLGIH